MLTGQYIPPHLRNSDSIKDEKLLSHVKNSEKIEQKRLKLKGIIKNKDITILVDYKSTHNLVDIKMEK